MTRRAQTVADFPAEFLDAWNLALKGELMLTMDSVGAARNMIQRLYTYRKRLAEEAPHLATNFYLVDLRVHAEDGTIITGRKTLVPGKAIIKPATLGWKDQIRKQNSSLEGAKENTVGTVRGNPKIELSEPLTQPAGAVPDTDNLSEALSNAGYGTGEG